MKKMKRKKMSVIIITGIMLIGITACGNTNDSTVQESKIPETSEAMDDLEPTTIEVPEDTLEEENIEENIEETDRRIMGKIVEISDTQITLNLSRQFMFPEGEMPEGELPEGEMPEGEIPEGEAPNFEMGEMEETIVLEISDQTEITINGEIAEISDLDIDDMVSVIIENNTVISLSSEKQE